MTDFNLSNFIERGGATYSDSYKIKLRYIREFIKLETELICEWNAGRITFADFLEKRHKLAGEQLK